MIFNRGVSLRIGKQLKGINYLLNIKIKLYIKKIKHFNSLVITLGARDVYSPLKIGEVLPSSPTTRAEAS